MTLRSRWIRLSQRERGLLALAATVAVLYVGILYIGIPLKRHFDDARLEIEQKKILLEGYSRTIGREASLKKAGELVRTAAGTFDPLYLKSTKPALAAAEVQSMIKEAATLSEVSVTSEKILKTVPGASHTGIPVEITVAGDIVRLRDFLFALETGKPLLRISEINLRTVRKRSFDSASKKYLDIEELQATLLVSGIMRGGV
jgi:hypothetical protein